MPKWLLGLAVAALTVAPTRADDAAAVVKKAIAAHGGAEALNKYTAGSYKIKGDMTVQGTDLDFTGDILYQLPAKFRMTIDANLGGQKLTVVQVTNGKKHKTTLNGMEQKMSAAEKAELDQAAMMQEVSQLTPLVEGKKYTIKSEKDADVKGKPASVVLVTAKDFKDTRLYFDKKTGLLVKTERKGLAPGAEKPQEVTEESYMSDFKKVDGVMLPMKITVNHDGKKFMSMTVTDAKMMEKADPKAFAVDD